MIPLANGLQSHAIQVDKLHKPFLKVFFCDARGKSSLSTRNWGASERNIFSATHMNYDRWWRMNYDGGMNALSLFINLFSKNTYFWFFQQHTLVRIDAKTQMHRGRNKNLSLRASFDTLRSRRVNKMFCAEQWHSRNVFGGQTKKLCFDGIMRESFFLQFDDR